ncbi:hypothetical protein EZV62_016147 [Acer yangbiense]|uniref:Plant PDR ABC transporter associated domain-containing protein n=1 Tax=Acer yangbiense TaxID=1000413 RepID=A0A5C7HNG7_9ROSI|nr:hypothetical protein EZV62_016147 [Acer yangbiense]
MNDQIPPPPPADSVSIFEPLALQSASSMSLLATEPIPDLSSDAKTIGKLLLKSKSFFTKDYMFWVCVGALFG